MTKTAHRKDFVLIYLNQFHMSSTNAWCAANYLALNLTKSWIRCSRQCCHDA